MTGSRERLQDLACSGVLIGVGENIFDMDRAAFHKGAPHDKPASWWSRKQAVKGPRLIR
jgi:hypothetical protein